MKLGFLTGILTGLSIYEKIKWAHDVGFKTLEVSCWPRLNSRDYSGSDIDVANLTEDEARKIRDCLRENDMTICTLAYYDNNLDHDPAKRKAYNGHLLKVIDAAAMLCVKSVGTFIGRDMTLTIEDNFPEMEKVFRPILDHAAAKKVKVLIENCSMPGWHPCGWAGTISYSPELWDEMFRRLPNENFGLNYDPSHLVWLGVDYLQALRDYRARIFEVHAKDTEVLTDKRGYYSILGKQLRRTNEWDFGYWRHRMPGRGDIDWGRFIKTLKEIGYDDELVIEHEDLEYQDSPEKVKDGLRLGYDFLSAIL